MFEINVSVGTMLPDGFKSDISAKPLKALIIYIKKVEES